MQWNLIEGMSLKANEEKLSFYEGCVIHKQYQEPLIDYQQSFTWLNESQDS